MSAEHITPLPVDVRPHAAESVDSYIRRLAQANHLRPSYLHGYLCAPPGYTGAIQPARLAAVSGRPLHILQRALPALRPPADSPRPVQGSKPPAIIRAETLQLYAAIRRDAEAGYSIRALAARHYTGRRTVRQALASATPPPRKTPRRQSWALDHVREHIDTLLQQDLSTLQIWELLIDEHQASIGYSTISPYIARRRKEIWPHAHPR